jgi:uncharacterized RDD family membrane protein YckC
VREEWYVELDGAAAGPHDRQVLVQMRHAGRIHANTLVWRAGFAEWQQYADAGFNEPPVFPPPIAVVSAQAELPPAITDAARAFDMPADHAPPINSAFEHENLMRRVIADRNRGRHQDETIKDLPPEAPRLEVEDDGWQWVGPAPWRRYLARMLDISVLGMFTWMIFGVVAAATNIETFEILFHTNGLMKVPLLSSVVVVASLIPVQALLIGVSGMTIGKWIFGVRVTRRDGRAIGFRDALIRELNVFGLGVACGVPGLNLIAGLIAYNVLSKTGCTQWDRGRDWVVTQREPGDIQNMMFVLGLAAFFVVGVIVRYFQELAK